jgi:hypothetical protein
MRKLILIFTIAVSPFIGAQGFKMLTWKDLEPPLDFDDPFEKLELSELRQLGELSYYRQIENIAKDELTEYELKRKDSIIKWLTNANIDYEYLFEMRPKIEEMRAKKGKEVNKALDKTQIEISGYLLPLNFDQGKANEFLLVPWVGACIHTPPPPKNQIIHVKTKEWMDAVGLYDPVVLSGRLDVVETVSQLYLVDGNSMIISGYTVNDATIIR